MYEFSQKFKTFYLNLCAIEIDPILLASYLKIPYKIKPYKTIFKLRYKLELDLL
jgi:hypothetical protein